MDNLTVIVLAAGGGTRMKSKTMKVLHPIAGRSMIGHVLRAVQAVEPTSVVAVVGHQREQVGPHITELLPEAVLAVQEKQEGTGHAVRIAMEAVGTTTGTVIVAAGDTPLLQGDDRAELELWDTKWIPEGHDYAADVRPERLADLVIPAAGMR